VTDLIINNQVIVETKVADIIHPNHIAQLLSYLNLTGIQVGLLLNFKNASLQFKRVTLSKPKTPLSTPESIDLR
jgi:GxxExxY protein